LYIWWLPVLYGVVCLFAIWTDRSGWLDVIFDRVKTNPPTSTRRQAGWILRQMFPPQAWVLTIYFMILFGVKEPAPMFFFR
jgi:hypothetical protein